MGCINSKIKTELDVTPVINEKEVKEVKEVKEIKEIPISNEVKKINIKVNIIRPNPMNSLEENKNLRIKIPSNKQKN